VTGDGGGELTVAIVGAGFAGLCMGMKLRAAGLRAFTIYEKERRIGGVWRDNTYPGAACDVPSAVYSYSFEPRHDWPHVYSSQREIQRYLESFAQRHGLGPHIRTGTEIAGARFDAAAGLWRLRTRSGEEASARVLVTATGQLSRPHLPDIPGLDSFAGTRFHSARWNHDHDLAGRRVAVIGNGASAVQLIPHVARAASELTVFQRSASWVMPPIPTNRAYRAWERWAFLHVPALARLHRAALVALFEARLPGLEKGSRAGRIFSSLALRSMRSQVADPELRRALTPDYPIGCKRILLSTEYYPALTRPNVRVVTDPILRFTPEGVETRDGLHAVDTIILATGFDTLGFIAPMEVEGPDGRLAEAWREGAEAYLGVAVAGFPNLFLLYGPNTNLGHHSVVILIESQVEYVMKCLARLGRERLRALVVKADVQARYNRELQRRLADKVWDAGCTSWYKTASGRNTNNWPGSTREYQERLRRHDPADFEVVPG
jgi:cation diffusion facilitator CzcD-associated flavoprotein CzcO